MRMSSLGVWTLCLPVLQNILPSDESMLQNILPSDQKLRSYF